MNILQQDIAKVKQWMSKNQIQRSLALYGLLVMFLNTLVFQLRHIDAFTLLFVLPIIIFSFIYNFKNLSFI